MPFGLCNAPTTFQELMNIIFSQHLQKFVLVFFDDILVYSLEEHLDHLHTVLYLLRNHQLKAKLSKCLFGQPQVEYLGHIISAQGVQTDPGKIHETVKWAVPETVKKLGYYICFIKKYSVICQPLHQILKKNSFHWGPEQQLAFYQLMTVMTTPPIHALPDFSLPFTLENRCLCYWPGSSPNATRQASSLLQQKPRS
jgi:hypothetical protein